jgi:hypothetical protein
MKEDVPQDHLLLPLNLVRRSALLLEELMQFYGVWASPIAPRREAGSSRTRPCTD